MKGHHVIAIIVLLMAVSGASQCFLSKKQMERESIMFQLTRPMFCPVIIYQPDE